MIYLTPNTIAELACLLLSLVFLFREKEPIWRMQILYLLTTVIVEITGIYIRLNLNISNIHLYSAFITVETVFISFFFYNLYKPYGTKKKSLIIWLIIFSIVFLSDLILNQFKSFVSSTATVISIVFVFFSLYYFYLKLNNNTYERLTFSAPFWWVTGTLFFYFGSTTCNLFFDYLIQSKSLIRYSIFSILNIILYTFWSYAFLCRYLQRRSYS